jgi:hypothetical protein
MQKLTFRAQFQDNDGKSPYVATRGGREYMKPSRVIIREGRYEHDNLAGSSGAFYAYCIVWLGTKSLTTSHEMALIQVRNFGWALP